VIRYSTYTTNQALRRIGVVAADRDDEFNVLDLGDRRDTEVWGAPWPAR
jgi:hypothetical protein